MQWTPWYRCSIHWQRARNSAQTIDYKSWEPTNPGGVGVDITDWIPTFKGLFEKDQASLAERIVGMTQEGDCCQFQLWMAPGTTMEDLEGEIDEVEPIVCDPEAPHISAPGPPGPPGAPGSPGAPVDYEMMRSGHCAAGWISPNAELESLDACAERCRKHQDCGYFAYDGKMCMLYTKDGGCPSDGKYHEKLIYRMKA